MHKNSFTPLATFESLRKQLVKAQNEVGHEPWFMSDLIHFRIAVRQDTAKLVHFMQLLLVALRQGKRRDHREQDNVHGNDGQCH